MAGKSTSVLALFASEAASTNAVSRLRDAGFHNTDVAILMQCTVGNKNFGHEKQTKSPEGVATGGTAGAIIGGTIGWLAGIGALAIPGAGPLIASGPIMAALAGLGTGAAVGGVAGGLVGAGISEYEAKRFEGMIRQGKVLLSVQCDDSTKVARAKDILQDSGAHDISSRSEASAKMERAEATKRPLPNLVSMPFAQRSYGDRERPLMP